MTSWANGMIEIVMATTPELGRCPPRSMFAREVVEAATARLKAGWWASAVPCVSPGPQGRGKCRHPVAVELSSSGFEVRWRCGKCGDDGVVTGFVATDADLRDYRPRGKTVNWAMTPSERTMLLGATERVPAMRSLVARAWPHAEVPDMLVVQATVAELNALYALVEGLCTRRVSTRRKEALDDLRASLGDAIDGF